MPPPSVPVDRGVLWLMSRIMKSERSLTLSQVTVKAKMSILCS